MTFILNELESPPPSARHVPPGNCGVRYMAEGLIHHQWSLSIICDVTINLSFPSWIPEAGGKLSIIRR